MRAGGCTDGLLVGTPFSDPPSPGDGLFSAFRGLLDVTFCIDGLQLPEDGCPVFGVLRVVFT